MAPRPVVGTAAVTDRHVEIAVGAERQVTCVVVPVGLRNLQQSPLGVRSGGEHPVLDCELREHERVAVPVGHPLPQGGAVPDEQPSVLLEPGMERDSEQPSLAAEAHLIGDVE